VDESASLPALVAETAPGKSAQARVWREGKEVTLNVTVGNTPDAKEKVASADVPAANSGKLGLQVRSSP
jgi:hypothetical protein